MESEESKLWKDNHEEEEDEEKGEEKDAGFDLEEPTRRT